jgi:hypothetical protein
MDERLKFVAGLLDGEKMAVLCRRFGVSRKTGYKILERYNSCGLEGLTDRSRRPYRHANQLPVQIGLIGEPLRYGSVWLGFIRTSIPRRSALCMRFWTAMGWSSAGGAGVIKPPAHRCRPAISPMICGALTTRASSCWPIAAIAIR